MSKLKVSGNASGTGVITLEAPNTNTDRAITLPDSAGELINIAPSTSGNVLTSDGTNWTSAAAGGKVLQVVYGSTTTSTASTSTSYADSTLSASITPATNSKVMVLVSQNVSVGSTSSGNAIGLQILRDSTPIISTDNILFGFLSLNWGDMAFNYLDSAVGGDGSTSITYKTQLKSRDSGETVTCQNSSNISSITLMEIGA
jgi:hypothetical protein